MTERDSSNGKINRNLEKTVYVECLLGGNIPMAIEVGERLGISREKTLARFPPRLEATVRELVGSSGEQR